ncbi:MAG: RIP metalloprotease RseP [Halothiobacillaceae bacterium]
MIEVLASVLAFIVTIGVLVAFHEYGHFWVARRLGVRVLTYSIGFGRTLWSTRRGPEQIEYRIGALPLGGYVRMLDEREGPVDPAERHRAFNRQPLWRRAAIVLAGPAANVLMAILAWWLMFMVGVGGPGSFVAEPQAGTPAAEAGLRDGDQVVAVGNQKTLTLETVRMALLDASLNQRPVTITVERGGIPVDLTLDLTGIEPLRQDMARNPQDVIEMVGLVPWTPPGPAIVREVQPGSAGASAGLREGDVILRADGAPYRDPRALIGFVAERPDTPVVLEVERGGQRLEVPVTPRAEETGDGVIGRIGVMLGMDVSDDDRERFWVVERLGPIDAFGAALQRSWDMTALTFRVMGRLISGEASLSNIAGPVTIADYAGKSALIGVATFLGFLALVSLSLAIVNLLPVPMLDGGHLLMYLVEAIRGRPMGEQAEGLFQRIGFTVLIGLMALAFYNDAIRLLG